MIIIISVAAFTNYLENKNDEGVCRGKIEQHFPRFLNAKQLRRETERKSTKRTGVS